MNRRYAIWICLILFLVAFSARLVPLQFSGLPYNIDGYPLARISEQMIADGGIGILGGQEGLLGYNMKMPVFPNMLASFSLVLGVEPLELLPYFCALMGSIAVIFIFTLTRELTRNDLAAATAGLFAALSGLFVYVTTAAMKQLLAIVLLCFIFYLFSKRKDWRFRLGLIMALALLPFTHHLTTLIALLALTFALVGTAFRRSDEHVKTVKEFMLDAATGPGILMVSLAYYRAVSLEFVSEVANINDVVLLASVVIIMAVFARLLSITVQTKPWFFLGKDEDKKIGLFSIFDEKVLVLLVGMGFLYLNSRIHVFIGGTMTSDALLKLIFPYLALTVVGLMGFNVIRYSRFPRRYLLVGMFLAPLCVMVFSMLRDLDVFGLMLVYRSYNFIDIPMAVVVGVGTAYLFGKGVEMARKNNYLKLMPAFVIIISFLFIAASLPLAYNSQEMFDVQEVSYEYELEAMEWADEHHIPHIATDQRYSDIIEPYYGIEADRTGAWKMDRGGLQEGDVTMASMYWTEIGAQFYPFDRIEFTGERMDELMESWDIVYCGGPRGREMVIGIVR